MRPAAEFEPFGLEALAARHARASLADYPHARIPVSRVALEPPTVSLRS